jgi:type II secretory pathway component PulM
MAFEALQDRWEHMTPRERRLMALLGVAAVITLFVFVGRTIWGGLDEIDQQNEVRRDALRALEVYRAQQALGVDDQPDVVIPAEPVDLPAYLEDIANEVGVEIPSYSPQPQGSRGNFDEIAVNIEVREITIQQLATLLEKIETKNRAVVITELHIERSFREDDKLRKAGMTVTTYARSGGQPGPAPAGAAEARDGGGEEG